MARTLFATLALALCGRAGGSPPGVGPLAAFLRRGTRGGAAEQGPVVLPLVRRLVEVGSEADNGTAPMMKSFYVGAVRVGTGGAELGMEVFFDTSSGQVILDSVRCEATPCLLHRRYSPTVDLRLDGAHVPEGRRGNRVDIRLDSNDAAPGRATGDLVRDTLCLGPLVRTACAQVRRLSFGGYNEARLAAPLSWTPVARPEEGFWQVGISSIRVGGRSLGLCERFSGGCRGVVDSSSANLGVPSDLMPALLEALAVSSTEGGPCSGAVGPDLHLVLEGGATLTLGPREYAGPSARAAGGCGPQLHSVSTESKAAAGRFLHNGTVRRAGGLAERTLLLGEPLLRRYYTVFDLGAERIGFGLAAPSTLPGLEPTPAAEEPPPQEDFVLMQTCRPVPTGP
ncbi:unnamed protein product [Prorocentrum cordatum]|uniref:Peptidase A1 domain-containing protein n=1 Tax=Prorocentrum cordatum TaxID=2364126 RepID=A0ABN9WEV5_9DINO|nr:unnamed protein product [Polarella glacialis]